MTAVCIQGGYGTFQTVDTALRQGCQVVLVGDSDGAATVIAELLEPLLEHARELTYENRKRRLVVDKRIEEYRRANFTRLKERLELQYGAHDDVRQEPLHLHPRIVCPRRQHGTHKLVQLVRVM